MVFLIYMSLVNVIASSHQRPLLDHSDKIQRFIDEINFKNNFNENFNKFNNVSQGQLKDANQESNVYIRNEETDGNGMDELLNIIDKQLTLKGKVEEQHLNTQVNKVNDDNNIYSNLNDEIEDVDVLLVDLTNLRKNININEETDKIRDFLRKSPNPNDTFKWKPNERSVKKSGGKSNKSFKDKSKETRKYGLLELKRTNQQNPEYKRIDERERVYDTFNKLKPKKKSKVTQSPKSKEISRAKSSETPKLKSKAKSEDTKDKSESEDKFKVTDKPKTKHKKIRKLKRKKESDAKFKTKRTTRGQRTTAKPKKARGKLKPESSLHDTLPLIPEIVASNYKQITEGLARSVLKYINGQEELDKQNVRPNKLKRIQQLQTDAIYKSMTESEIEYEIMKIFFGDDSNTKIYSLTGKYDITYAPRWLFTFLYTSKPSIRDNGKKSRSILPLTKNQKNRKKKLEGLDKRKTVKRKWGKDLQDSVWNYGVPFELKIQGLGQTT